MDKSFLCNVYGYTKVKEELYAIRNWYFNYDENKNSKISLPKGLLFHGRPGSGKTHIIREYSKSFNYPVFIVEGKDDNIDKEVIDIYEKAKEEKKAIVIIDELDKLINKDYKLTRVIMSQLDGFSKNENVLTLATANRYNELPEELIREGRFDRHFYINSVYEEINDVLRCFAKDAGIKLSDDDFSELEYHLDRYKAGELKAIFNNAALRYGSCVTVDDIIDTADFLKTGNIRNNNKQVVTYETAIHEAGHAVYTHLCSKTEKVLRIIFNEFGGSTLTKNVSEYETKESRINNIRIGLAGVVAEDIIIGGHDIGCGSDLDKVYDLSYRLVNRTCINGIDRFCASEIYYGEKKGSEYNDKAFEKKAMNFLKKNYSVVKRELKKYKDKIEMLANYLMKNKGIKREALIKLVGGH